MTLEPAAHLSPSCLPTLPPSVHPYLPPTSPSHLPSSLPFRLASSPLPLPQQQQQHKPPLQPANIIHQRKYTTPPPITSTTHTNPRPSKRCYAYLPKMYTYLQTDVEMCTVVYLRFASTSPHHTFDRVPSIPHPNPQNLKTSLQH